LIVDATCTPADITFPTDLKLLNTSREKSEEIIDILHRPLKGKQKKPLHIGKESGKNIFQPPRAKSFQKVKDAKRFASS
jgi:IS5 family transposase